MDSPGKRLQLFREMLGLSQADFAKSVGVSTGQIGNIESDYRRPSAGFMAKLSDAHELSTEWLLYGRGEMRHAREPGFHATNSKFGKIKPADKSKPMAGDFVSDDEEFFFVRRYDVSASAGNGISDQVDGVVDRIAFQASWLRRRGVTPDFAGLVQARGVSMEPLIPDGALLLVRFDIQASVESGVYVFRNDGELYVKNLVFAETDGLGRPTKIFVSSQNTGHKPYLLTSQDQVDFRLIAKVVSVVVDL